MSERSVVGVNPWLPSFLARFAWWTEPVRAERLASLRIGVAAVLLLDIFGHYLPWATDFLGPGSLGATEVFPPMSGDRYYVWSLFRGVESPAAWHGIFALWILSAMLLLAGAGTRVAAAAAWALGVSVCNSNPHLVNSGDNVRNTLLFYLMLCPCGAVWSVDHWLAHRRERASGTVFVYPWALRLLFVQLTVLYFMSGLFKRNSPDWPKGTAMYYHLANLAWTRLPFEQLPFAQLLALVANWVTLIWELAFPLLVFLAWTRTATLWLGVLFHLGTAFLFQLGPFPFYMLCFYLPLVPWERYMGPRSPQDIGGQQVAVSAPAELPGYPAPPKPAS
jgi:hypothetical protein